MIEGIFISASGMLPKSTRHEAIANNLANIEVPGFKRDAMFLREVQEAIPVTTRTGGPTASMVCGRTLSRASSDARGVCSV